MRRAKGFSLIELLIVIAIILIIAAIAIPNLMRARIASNESAAVNQIRTLSTAEVSYNTSYSTVGYGTLAALGPSASTPCTPSSANACLIDGSLSSNYGGNGKDGYSFAVQLSNNNANYTSTATPLIKGTTGTNSFCSTDDGVLRKDSTGNTDSSYNTCAALPSTGS